ncbi:MAG: sulfotransferase domain-containing protein [Gammaproteobacteria bacterium]|nr:sulfotransferase domain-containing protein [Gammaproteobacteria bacterium]
MTELPKISRTYQSVLLDSRRWDGFVPRADDIVISTSYKGGTTWTQAICGALIFQSPHAPGALDDISPWLDMAAYPLDSVLGRLEAQEHRRYIKTHLPLCALPFYEKVKYIFVGRDGRDVWMSMWNHWNNMKPEALAALNKSRGHLGPTLPTPGDDMGAAFDAWLSTPTFEWEKDGYPFWSHHFHAQSWWDFRHQPNLLFVHFADLLDDLDGQMRRIAQFLNIEVDEATWTELVHSVTFKEMQSNARERAPGGNGGMWKDPQRFFHRGQNRRWEGALTPIQIQRYEQFVRDTLCPELVDWLVHDDGFVDPRCI